MKSKCHTYSSSWTKNGSSLYGLH